jgi:hypothetical protein
MLRAVKLATLALCATAALSPSTPAHAQDLQTWLFAEGSTSGVLGFEDELLFGNPHASPVNVQIAVYTQDGDGPYGLDLVLEPQSRTGVNMRSIPNVGDRAGIAVRVTASAPIIAERTMYWGGGLFRGGKSWSAPVTDLRGGHSEKGANAGAKTWYFAEGEGKFFNTFFSVANSNATPATVTASYRNDAGEEITQSVEVPANGRRTFWPTAFKDLSDRLAPGRAGFATTITSDIDVVAERQMYWGPGAPFGIRGGHAAMGVTTPSAQWLFAEGVQGGAGGFDTYLLLFNQQTTATTVTVKFFGDGGVALAELVRTMPAGSRDNVPASIFPALANQAFAMQVEASQPIVAERAVYWRGFSEGHATAGATEARLKWGFAEGQQGGFLMYQDAADGDKRRFNTFFPLYNPGETAANVTVHFYTEGSSTGVTKQVVVPAKSRQTVWTVEYEELANQKFATFFASDQPIVVERAVYWGANNRAGHASVGTPLPDGFALAAPTALPAGPAGALFVTPNRGTPSGGTTVEIEGLGFGHSELGTQVLFGGKPAASFEVENKHTIRAVTPPGTTGAVDVTVITRSQTLTAPAAFTYFDPNVAGPRVSYGDLFGLVQEVANSRRNDLFNSCTEHGGNNTFMFEVVAALRRRFQTNRWGLNWKRGNIGDLSQDIVNYYSGDEGTLMRNSTNVRIYDIIGGHCGNRPGPFWVDQTGPTRAAGTVGKWTSDPMCRSARYRDAKFDNGEWMFPECR